METPVVLLLIGGLLLLIALVGGGMEVKGWLQIPKIERLARLFCGAAGVVLVLLGVRLHEDSQSKVGPQEAKQDAPEVQFFVFQTLSQEGLHMLQAEKTRIVINGILVGYLIVTPDFPALDLPITVAGPGMHSYAIETAVNQTENGQTMQVSCSGAGQINVKQGARFSLEGRIRQDGSCPLWLEEKVT